MSSYRIGSISEARRFGGIVRFARKGVPSSAPESVSPDFHRSGQSCRPHICCQTTPKFFRIQLVSQYVERHALPPGRHIKPLRDDLPTEDPDRSKHVGGIKAAARYQVVHPKAEHEQ
jgi:hypothetical protein